MYSSGLKLSGIGNRNLYPLCLLTMVYICDMHGIQSLSILMLEYIVEHLIKTGVNVRKSIGISIHDLTGTCSGVTRPCGGLVDCLTR